MAFRGLDRYEVESLLQVVAARIEELEAECVKLQGQVAETPGRDLQSEFEAVGREVTSILQTARDAADSMRERAETDSARWRTEATEEAETARREAAADAEALRRDAWVTGSDLLEQAQKTAEDMRAMAERDVLTVMGEAEREAHRLTSGARREAEDLVRNANMDAEKIRADATSRRDEIIDNANRQTATAQERTRALEARRDELLEELENVRTTLTRLEGSLEERREALDLTKSTSEPTSVRVVHSPAEAKKDWELGETVRVVQPDDNGRPGPDTGIAEEVSDQVARIQDTEQAPDPEPEQLLERKQEAEAGSQPEPEPRQESAPEPQAEPVSEPEPVSEAVSEPERVPVAGPEPQIEDEPTDEPADDDIPADDHELEALFASLRGSDDEVQPASEPEDSGEANAGEEQPHGSEETADDGTDWIAVRDSRLLPIANRALRGVKKAMTEVQNVALDSLRTDDDWRPDVDSIAESVRAELEAVWSESFAVGHAVAEEMSGERLDRPATPASNAEEAFASGFAESVIDALDNSGDGPRERQSAASRVFRVWRSDEAERRIRDIAFLAYETGIEESRRVATGQS